MADEVIISEHGAPQTFKNGQVMPILGPIVTTQVLDTATLSAALNDATRMVRITARADIWVKIGTSAVSAATDTDGNFFLASGGTVDLHVEPGQYIDTAADA